MERNTLTTLLLMSIIVITVTVNSLKISRQTPSYLYCSTKSGHQYVRLSQLHQWPDQVIVYWSIFENDPKIIKSCTKLSNTFKVPNSFGSTYILIIRWPVNINGYEKSNQLYALEKYLLKPINLISIISKKVKAI